VDPFEGKTQVVDAGIRSGALLDAGAGEEAICPEL
jgi:hypothetical protein